MRDAPDVSRFMHWPCLQVNYLLSSTILYLLREVQSLKRTTVLIFSASIDVLVP